MNITQLNGISSYIDWVHTTDAVASITIMNALTDLLVGFLATLEGKVFGTGRRSRTQFL
jgi:hypothetical protein